MARVYLVGAGPGSPGLMTVRGAELLAQADLIVYDQLVPKRLLDGTRADAEKVCVRDLPGLHPDKYPHIYNKLIEAAKAGKCVVRLKGGDPLIFGRGGEEAEAMRAEGVHYEIVPGVTAALAAAAYLDLPLTHRGHTSAVAFVTGHELPQKPGNKLDWSALAKFPGTLAIYMGIARLPVIAGELMKHGKDPDTPCAIVERASLGEMRTISSRLADLESARRSAGLEAPGLILVGEAVGHRQPQSWFEKAPLYGRRVLVTRPRHQAEGMVRKLENLGAVPFTLPIVSIRDVPDFTALDQALDQLKDGHWDWLVFTSTNGVQHFMARLFARGRDLRELGRIKLAAIGSKTAEALKAFHLNADVVPAEFRSEGLVEALKELVYGKRVLLARANRGREVLNEELGKIAKVHQVVVYEQVDDVDVQGEVFAALRRGEIEFITLSSSNIARGLLKQFDETLKGRVVRGELKLVAISPETAKAIGEFGLPVHAVAEVFTSDGLIEAVVRAASQAT